MTSSYAGYLPLANPAARAPNLGRRKPLVLACVVLTLFGITALTHSPLDLELVSASGTMSNLDPTHTSLRARVVGGLPGYWVMDNVYYNNYTFYMYGDNLPPEAAIISRDAGLVHVVTSPEPFPFNVSRGYSLGHVAASEPELDSGHRFIDFPGTTLFNNEGARPGMNFLDHYYHFAAETLLGGFAALSSVGYPHEYNGDAEADGKKAKRGLLNWLPTPGYGNGRGEKARSSLPDRLVLPWSDRWKDRWGLNQLMVEGLYGEGDVIDMSAWGNMTLDSTWVHFDRVIMVDRFTSHEQNLAAKQFNKMALPIFEHPHDPAFFRPARSRLLAHYGIPLAAPHSSSKAASGSHAHAPPPRVLYIDRQPSRRHLIPTAHEALVALLTELDARGTIEFVHAHLEKMTGLQQFEAMAHASIIMGVHGNGLTHALWAPEDSTVIEFFPPDAWTRDYECVATVLGLDYVQFANDTVRPREVYADFELQKKAKGQLSTGEFPLHVPALRIELERILSASSRA